MQRRCGCAWSSRGVCLGSELGALTASAPHPVHLPDRGQGFAYLNKFKWNGCRTAGGWFVVLLTN
jgi:hypothetical protein